MIPAETFFNALYKGQTGVLELRTFGPEKSNESHEAEQQRRAARRLRDFIPVVNGSYDIERVKKFLAGCERARLGAFFGVALRAQEAIKLKKGDSANCQTLTALFVDADYKHLGEAETRKRIAACRKTPSLLVCSGGGLHPYWVLESPIHLQVTGGMKKAKLHLRKLAKTVADVVDETVSEPVRVLRVPGSYNFKKEYGEPRQVVLEIGPDDPHVPDNLVIGDFGMADDEPPLVDSWTGEDEIFTGEVPE